MNILFHQKNYDKFYKTFEDLFENHSIVIDDEELKRYSKNWHRPAVSKDLDKYDIAVKCDWDEYLVACGEYFDFFRYQ